MSCIAKSSEHVAKYYDELASNKAQRLTPLTFVGTRYYSLAVEDCPRPGEMKSQRYMEILFAPMYTSTDGSCPAFKMLDRNGELVEVGYYKYMPTEYWNEMRGEWPLSDIICRYPSWLTIDEIREAYTRFDPAHEI